MVSGRRCGFNNCYHTCIIFFFVFFHVFQVGDVDAVYRSLVFSKDFSFSEIEERWYQLMYDDALSRQAKKRMQELNPEIILKIQVWKKM